MAKSNAPKSRPRHHDRPHREHSQPQERSQPSMPDEPELTEAPLATAAAPAATATATAVAPPPPATDDRRDQDVSAIDAETNAKYEQVKGGKLYIKDLQQMDIYKLHEIAKEEGIQDFIGMKK